MLNKFENLSPSNQVLLVTGPSQMQELRLQIESKMRREPDEEIVLGLDCEGLHREKQLSLLQLFFEDTAYVFDLLRYNPMEDGLKEILESKTIIKIFHDFCEDAAAIMRQYKVTIAQVFDTQIAHRELVSSEGNYTYKDSNISLNSLLRKYLNTENGKKTEICDEMTNNLEFWEQRPLTVAMIEYAAQDVIHLPQVYEIFKKQMRKSLVAKIFEKSSHCHYYSLINESHPGIHFCEKGQYLGAYIKNFYKFAIFCSLNIGSSGIVVEKKSRDFIKYHFQVGEILNLEVVSINEEKNSIELKVPEYYLQMEPDTMKQYCKLAKMSQEDKHKKAVAALVKSGVKKQRKISMSVKAKAFFPKSQSWEVKKKSGSFDDTKPMLESKAYSEYCIQP